MRFHPFSPGLCRTSVWPVTSIPSRIAWVMLNDEVEVSELTCTTLHVSSLAFVPFVTLPIKKIIQNHYWIINTKYVDIYLRHEKPNPRELKRCRNVQDPDTQTQIQSNRRHRQYCQNCLRILHPCILMRTKPQKHTSRPVSRPHYHLPHQ